MKIKKKYKYKNKKVPCDYRIAKLFNNLRINKDREKKQQKHRTKI